MGLRVRELNGQSYKGSLECDLYTRAAIGEREWQTEAKIGRDLGT